MAGGQRPRVVFVDHVARLSGGELALLGLLPELSRHVDVRVVLGEDGPLVDRLETAAIPVDVLALAPAARDLPRASIRPRSVGIGAAAASLRYVEQLRRRLRGLRPDLVHTNSLKSAVYGGIAARLAGIPAVWHVRDRIAPDYLPLPAVRLVRLLARTLPVGLIANSRTTLATLPTRRHSLVLYNAVQSPPAPPPPVERPLTVGMIGRLAPWKGQHVFLAAFAEAFGGTEVRAHIVGSALFGEDAHASSLVTKAAELGVAGQVEFRGFREDVWDELARLDVLVHASIRPEPFGQVVLEGLAAGVPVVAANAGGPAEVITNDVDGLLVRPGDPSALARTLRALGADADLRARLGAAGRIRSRDFAIESTVERLLAFYDAVLSRD
ncbi:MAG TPA: glycosyltransferase [Gaiellaceae bacterium]|nr:glycosyltransferase [Gaiellaceae bacterium]